MIDHRRYVARETAIGAVINGLLSFAFAVAVANGRDAIPLWGSRGIAVDFIPQVFMMMFAVTLAITLLTRKRISANQVQPLRQGGSLAAKLPSNAFLRALVVGLSLALLLSPLSAGILHAAGVDELPARAFIYMKTIFGATVTACVAPGIVRAALMSQSRGTKLHSEG